MVIGAVLVELEVVLGRPGHGLPSLSRTKATSTLTTHARRWSRQTGLSASSWADSSLAVSSVASALAAAGVPWLWRRAGSCEAAGPSTRKHEAEGRIEGAQDSPGTSRFPPSCVQKCQPAVRGGRGGGRPRDQVRRAGVVGARPAPRSRPGSIARRCVTASRIDAAARLVPARQPRRRAADEVQPVPCVERDRSLAARNTVTRPSRSTGRPPPVAAGIAAGDETACEQPARVPPPPTSSRSPARPSRAPASDRFGVRTVTRGGAPRYPLDTARLEQHCTVGRAAGSGTTGTSSATASGGAPRASLSPRWRACQSSAPSAPMSSSTARSGAPPNRAPREIRPRALGGRLPVIAVTTAMP